MKFLEAVAVVEEAVQEWDESWGDSEADTWSMGLRTRFKFLTHMLIELKNEIVDEGDLPEPLARIAALCMYWIMSDYHYKPDLPQEEAASMSRSSDGGYI